jgi:hypothetical protein
MVCHFTALMRHAEGRVFYDVFVFRSHALAFAPDIDKIPLIPLDRATMYTSKVVANPRRQDRVKDE